MAGASPTVRKARIAAAGLFLTNGALFANLVPRYPEIKADLALSNTFFGVAVAAFSAGALISGLAAAPLIRKFGSASVAVASSFVLAALVVIAGLAPSGLLLAVALFCAGSADSITDVAQNAQGLQVQREYGRSVLNSLHATWSAGAVLGGLIGAGAIALGVSRGVQLVSTSAVLGIVCILGRRLLLPGPVNVQSEPSSAPGFRQSRPRIVLLLATFVGLAIAGAVIEDAGMSWSALYLRDVLEAPPALAACGFIAVVGCQFIGRALGDRLVDRWGQRGVVVGGGLITAVGMGVALAYPSVWGTVIGFGAAGLGSATMVPAAMHAADEIPGLRPGTGLTVLTWLMRVGFLLSPLTVGALADAEGLRIALLTVPVAGIAALFLAQSLGGPNRSVGPIARGAQSLGGPNRLVGRLGQLNRQDTTNDQCDAENHEGR